MGSWSEFNECAARLTKMASLMKFDELQIDHPINGYLYKHEKICEKYRPMNENRDPREIHFEYNSHFLLRKWILAIIYMVLKLIS